jgi:putative ABC transport system permease protein
MAFTQRIRLVTRRLAHAPLFTSVAVLTLAVAIGANAAIFSVVNGVLLKPLPFQEPERLVGMWHTAPGMNLKKLNQSPATYLTYRDDNKVFEDVAMWDDGMVSVTGVGEPERIEALFVTDGLFPVLRIDAALGRRFIAQDDTPGAPDRVMLSNAYWQRKFGSDPAAIGKLVTIDGKPCEIIGVLPAGFTFLNRTVQVAMPFKLDRAKVFVGNFSYQGIGRLKPGVTNEQANADIARMVPSVVDRFPLPPGFNRQMFVELKMGANVHPLAEDVIGDVGRVLWILLGTVGIVLLIACANVANLFLVRAEGRQQELAIHAALGAGWRRLSLELLSESVATALIGGAIGLLLAEIGVRSLVALAPDGLPRVSEIAIDGRVMLFTLAISLLTGVLFGLIPVLKFATPNLAGALKQGGRLSSAGKERHRARNALVIAEVALAVVLLVASGLMIRTFQAMRHVNPGYTNPEQVLTFRVSIPSSVVKDEIQTARTHEQIAHAIEQVPGVTSVGLASSITMDGNDSNDPIFVEDFPSPEGKLPPLRRYKWIGGNHFQTMGTPLLAGRAITWNDAYTEQPIVMVSENFAREFWKEPSQAIGRRIRNTPDSPWRTIAGVVADERDDGVAQPAPKVIYWPAAVKDFWGNPRFVARSMGYVVRTERMKSPTLLKELQQAVWGVNPNLPLASVRTLPQIAAESMAQTSFALVMLAIAAGVALLLGVVGIYGVIAYLAAQRTREIGIRIALGAGKRDVSKLFLRHGSALAAVGIAIGLVAAALATRVMSAMLFGVNALDPLTYVAVAAALGGTALLASYVPAMRATRVDPAVALRTEL